MRARDLPKLLFFALVVRPLSWVVIGLNLHRPERLPRQGPAVVVANHNSHLDTLVLMSLFPLRLLPRVRPVAAADYFFSTPLRAAFARRLLGAVPVARRRKGRGDPLEEARAALANGDILILFPEGSRGEPGRLAPLRSGVAHLLQHSPATPVVPVYLRGLERMLPRGEALFVPLFCDVFVAAALHWEGDRGRFMAALEGVMQGLQQAAANP